MDYINTNEFLAIEKLIKEKVSTTESLHDLCKKHNIPKKDAIELEKIFIATSIGKTWVRSLGY